MKCSIARGLRFNTLRILELIETLDTGGAERVVTNLAFELQARHCTVHVVCLREKGTMPVPEEVFLARGIEITALNKADGFSVPAAQQIARYVREKKIDLIHTHNPNVHHYGVVASKLTGVSALVNTVHGTNTLKMQRWAEALYGISCRMTSRIVAVCESAADVCHTRMHIPHDKIRIISNGIDLSGFLKLQPAGRRNEFVFGTAARLDDVKDQHNLIKAFALVKKRIPNCRLEILGKGDLEQSLKQLAHDLEIESTIEFRGFSRDVASFLSGVDCFVLSSKSEGLPLAILEAMAAGLPIVSTAVGAIPDLVSGCRGGWLCEPQQSADLARAMILAVEANDRRERGLRCRERVVESYSVARMGEAYLALFREILDRYPKGDLALANQQHPAGNCG